MSVKEANAIELKSKILNEGEKIMKLLQSPDLKRLIDTKYYHLYEKTKYNYDKLRDFRYTVGMVSGQSAGKSSLINSMVLEYPILPFCMGSTTCAPTILKYGKNIAIEISVKSVKLSEGENNDSLLLEEKRSIKLTCSSVPKVLFDKMMVYLTKCYTVLGLKNILYFTKQPIMYYGTEITKEDLNLSYSDPKHIAMMMLAVLCTYANQNAEEQLLSGNQVELLNMQKELLHDFGLKDEEKFYTVTLYWDSPLLKKGLVFYDLPGLDSNNKNNNGYLSHEEITKMTINHVQTAVYVFKPEVTKEGENIISYFMNTEAIRELKSKSDRVIIAVNKIDLAGNMAAVERALDDAKASISKYSLKSKVFGISAQAYGDYLFYKKDIIGLHNTSVANEVFKIGDMNQLVAFTDLVKMRIESDNKTYPAEEFLNALDKLAENAVFTNVLSFVRSLYNLLLEIIRESKSRIMIIDALHKKIDSSTRQIINILQQMADKSSGEVQRIVTDYIDESLKEVLYEVNFTQTFNEFIQRIDIDMVLLKEKCITIRNNLSENFIGDVVISRNNGTEIIRPNYDNWNRLKMEVRNASLMLSFTSISNGFKKIIENIQEKCAKIDVSVKEQYNAVLTGLLNGLDTVIKNEFSKLDNFKGTVNDKIIINSIKNAISGVGEQIKSFVGDCLTDINMKLKDNDEIYALNEQLADLALDKQNLIENKIRCLMKEKTKAIEESGVLMQSTKLVRMSELDTFINNSFVISETWKNNLKETLTPDSLVLEYVTKAKQAKRKVLLSPAIAMNDKVSMSKKILENTSEADLKKYLEEKIFLLKILDEIGEISCDINEFDKILDEARRNQFYAEEMKNVDGIVFSQLTK